MFASPPAAVRRRPEPLRDGRRRRVGSPAVRRATGARPGTGGRVVPRGGGGRALLLVAGVALLAAACAGVPDDVGAGSTTSTATVDGTTVPGTAVDGTAVDGTAPGTA